ncbi:MAG TPA: TlpA disulfide reductase family protein [Acetobacteraceae bacterium]|jgi:thiol-disulfide isomerase/thioredoxin|nr:TlpA disulfide reductase family protein [Acetobacteraceae bacterium]
MAGSPLPRRVLLVSLGALGLLATPRRSNALPLDTLSDALERVNPRTVPPPISFKTATGARQTLADYRGKGLVLNIWATWCGPCVAEMPSLDRLAADIAPFGIAVLPISIDAMGLPAVKSFYATNRIEHLPMLLDPDGDVAHAFKLDGIPTSFIVDRSGRITGRVEGSVQWDTKQAIAMLRNLVEPLPQSG